MKCCSLNIENIWIDIFEGYLKDTHMYIASFLEELQLELQRVLLFFRRDILEIILGETHQLALINYFG